MPVATIYKYRARFIPVADFDPAYDYVADSGSKVDHTVSTIYDPKISEKAFNDDTYESRPNPQRLTFKLVKSVWLETHIIDAADDVNDLAGYIVKVYRSSDNYTTETCIFTGIIDALTEFERKTQMVTLTCYDFLSLVKRVESESIFLGVNSSSWTIDQVTDSGDANNYIYMRFTTDHNLTQLDIDNDMYLTIAGNASYDGQWLLLAIVDTDKVKLKTAYINGTATGTATRAGKSDLYTVQTLLEHIFYRASKILKPDIAYGSILFDYEINIERTALTPFDDVAILATDWGSYSWVNEEAVIGFWERDGRIYFSFYARNADTGDNSGYLAYWVVRFNDNLYDEIVPLYAVSYPGPTGLAQSAADLATFLGQYPEAENAKLTISAPDGNDYALKKSGAAPTYDPDGDYENVFFGYPDIAYLYLEYIDWVYGSYTIDNLLDILNYVNNLALYVDGNGKMWVQNKTTTSGVTAKAMTDGVCDWRLRKITRKNEAPDLSAIQGVGNNNSGGYLNLSTLIDAVNSRYDSLFGTINREVEAEIIDDSLFAIELTDRVTLGGVTYSVFYIEPALFNDVNVVKIKAYNVP